MKQIINGKIYNTETADHVANNEFSDGSNRMNCGRCTSLWKTKKGVFFAWYETCWQGEHDSLEPLSETAAKELFETLSGDPDDYEKYFGKAEEA